MKQLAVTVKSFISFLEIPSADEAEVYKIIQGCLELRHSYVFKEEIAPWVKEVITDPSTPKPNLNPFAYAAEQKTDVSLFLIFAALAVVSEFAAFFDHNATKISPCSILCSISFKW